MKAFSIGAIAVSAMLFFVPARAQQASTHEQHQHSQPAQQPDGMMDHQKMMADMKAADDRLQALADKMTTAHGEDRIRAIQDVVSELVKNQVAMHERMAMMQQQMMSQMPKK
jgi:hypothetical protein